MLKGSSAGRTSMTLARNTNQIESERLVLRRIESDDFDFFTRLHADPDVVRYIGHGRPSSTEESLTWLRSTLANYDTLSLGQLAVLRKSDGALIGRCGLSDVAVEARPTGTTVRVWYQRPNVPTGTELQFESELGYTFERSNWGQGYASEAARCVFDYACEILKSPRVISLIHPENERSLRVARRFGLQKKDVVSLAGSPRERYLWPSCRAN
jgi:ribosomal-protein-alanine N-acetyltransferase